MERKKANDYPVKKPMPELTRRGFASAIAGAVCSVGALRGQSAEPWAGDSVVDCHHHLRSTPEASITHLDGCHISNALFNAGEQVIGLVGMFHFSSAENDRQSYFVSFRDKLAHVLNLNV